MDKQIEISEDKSRLDTEMIFRFLHHDSYWSKGIPKETVLRSIEHSLCFGLYVDGVQAGFARVITDRATYAYLGDVFILPEQRGQGLSKKLIAHIVAHPDLQGLRRFVLATLDAHGLYAQFGFKPYTQTERLMAVHNPDVYRKQP